MRNTAALVAYAAVVAAFAYPSQVSAQRAPASNVPAKAAAKPAAKADTTAPAGAPHALYIGAFDLGGRAYTKTLTDQQKGKFEEYKDLPKGFAVEQLMFKYIPKDSMGTYQISGRNLGNRDQSAWLWANRPGSYDFQVRYDNIVHTLSTDARSLGTRTTPDYYSLPTVTNGAGVIVRPDSIAWRAAPFVAPLRTQWAPLKVSLNLTPTNALDTRIEVSRIDKRGEKPMGMAFGGSSADALETLEPIKQTIQDVRLTQAYTSKHFHLMGSFDYNKFDNSYTSVSADNPQAVANTLTTGAQTGRTALAPSNVAKTGSLTGLVNLPLHTRIVGTYTRSEFEQNVPFIPGTTNPLIASQLSALPETSAHGQARTTMSNVVLTSHPYKYLNLTGRLRTYDYSNSTPSVGFGKSTALNDRSVIAGETTEVRPFKKTNADLAAAYQVMPSTHLSLGYATEAWTRDAEIRNVGKTNEHTPRVAVDYSGFWWLTLHAGYSKGWKRFEGVYTPVSSSENPTARIFDVADRDREKVNLQASVNPISQVTITGTWEVRHDNYPNSAYGVQSDVSAMAGVDMEVTPVKYVTVNAGYTNDAGTSFGKFRYRTGSVDSLLNNPTWNWNTHNNDKMVSPYVSVNATIIPDRFDAGASWSNSDGQFQLQAANLSVPAKGTAAQIASATAFDFPVVRQKMTPVSLYLKYLYTPEWALTVRYQMERYSQTDYRLANPPSPNPIAGALSHSPTNILPGPLYTQIGNYYFLSNYYQNYNTGWFTVLISYHPKYLPFGSARATF